MEFRTIKEDGQVQEEIKKSRFICHAKRVYSEEEARDFIARRYHIECGFWRTAIALRSF